MTREGFWGGGDVLPIFVPRVMRVIKTFLRHPSFASTVRHHSTVRHMQTNLRKPVDNPFFEE